MGRFRHLLLLAPTAIALAVANHAQAAERYTVRWGDTLTWIARSHHVTLDRLARANHLDPYGVLVEGSVLRIPSSGHPAARRHPHHQRPHAHTGHIRSPASGGGHRITVGWGDTLTGIAARYGTSIGRLAHMNGLDPAGVLLAGARIRVPGRAPAQVAVATAPASGSWSAQASIAHWSAHYGVDVHLARAIAWQESGFQPGVVSTVGAWGVMQVMPATWTYVEGLIGHPVARTADGNVRIGVAYLGHLLHEFGGDERLATAAYYQGPGAVRQFGVLPASQLYVADVLSLRQSL
jgi:LysM repeat protein